MVLLLIINYKIMKKVKLMFALLVVALFVSTVVLSVNTDTNQAIKKSDFTFLPTNG